MNRNKNKVSNKNKYDKGKGNNYNRSDKQSGQQKQVPFPREKEEKLDDSFGNDATTYFPSVKFAEDNVKFSPEVILSASNAITDATYYVNVFAIQFNPCPGVSKYDHNSRIGQVSPISRAAQKFFTALCAFTGRIPSYGPQDIMFLILALESFIEICEWGRRAFGALYKFDMLNTDIPKRLIEAMGIDYDDFINNRETYIPQWNAIVNTADQLTVPDDIPILTKSLKLYQNIYRENDTELSALYVLNPSSAWILDEQSYEGGTVLKTVPWCDDYTRQSSNVSTSGTEINYGEAFRAAHPIRKFSYYISQFQVMVEALLNSTTVNLIRSDVVRYASKIGGFRLWKPDLVFEDYRTPIVLEDKFNKLLHNFTLVGIPTSDISTSSTGSIIGTPMNDVYPDPNTNAVVYNPGIYQYSCWTYCSASARGSDANKGMVYDFRDQVVDYDTSEPDINYRVDTLMYKAANGEDPFTTSVLANKDRWKWKGKINWDLPDHYVTSIHAYAPAFAVRDKDDLNTPVAYDATYNNGWFPTNYKGMLWPSNAALENGMDMHLQKAVGNGSVNGVEYYPWEPVDNHPIFWNTSIVTFFLGGDCQLLNRGYYVKGDLDNFMFITQRKLKDVYALTFQHMYMATHLDKEV